MGVWIPSKDYDLIFNDDAANCDDDVDDDVDHHVRFPWTCLTMTPVEG